jgi:hypothetical protein
LHLNKLTKEKMSSSKEFLSLIRKEKWSIKFQTFKLNCLFNKMSKKIFFDISNSNWIKRFYWYGVKQCLSEIFRFNSLF